MVQRWVFVFVELLADPAIPEGGRRCTPFLAGAGSALAPREREREGAVSYTHLTLPTICSV
eukprot:4969342-Alexandrium_andersonii.AAC.1